jgi:hypothetical protein
MNDHTRRNFLAMAGAGAAAAGVSAVAPSAVAATPPATTVPAGASGALIAHVADVHGDTVSMLVGDREVVVHDRELVARLARAAH